MKPMLQLLLATLMQFVFALVIGVTGLSLLSMVGGLAKEPRASINIVLSFSFYVSVLIMGGFFYFIPGMVSAFASALLFLTRAVDFRTILFIASAMIALVGFHFLDPFSSKESLSRVVRYTAPVSFGLAALLSRFILCKLFTSPLKTEQGAATNL